MTCGVYEFWCGPLFYQGSSTNIEARIARHRRDLETGGHYNRKCLAAFREYGWTGHSVLVECDEAQLVSWESDFIEANSEDARCLNIAKAVFPRTGRKRSKRKIQN